MDINTCFLWIGGLAAAYVLGHVITANKNKKKLMYLTAELSKAKDEAERLQQQLFLSKKQKSPLPTPSPQQVLGAKESFISNINLFKPHLNTLLNGTYNCDNWAKLIYGIKNRELSTYWEMVCRNTDSILRMLAMWGIRPETCTDFIGMEPYVEMYETTIGGSIENRQHYKVESPCWIMTNNYTGKKQVLLKGIVRLYETN